MGIGDCPLAEQKKPPSSSELVPLREQVEAWREAVGGSRPMPPDVWETAVELARHNGPCQIAHGVGICPFELPTATAALGMRGEGR